MCWTALPKPETSCARGKFIRIQNCQLQETNFASVQECRLGCPTPGGTISQKCFLQAAVASSLAVLPCPWNATTCNLPAGHFGTHLGDAGWASLLMHPHPEPHTFTCWVTSNLPDQPSFLALFQQRGVRAENLSPLQLLPDQIQPFAWHISPWRGNAAPGLVSQQGWGASVLRGFQDIGQAMPQLAWPGAGHHPAQIRGLASPFNQHSCHTGLSLHLLRC